MPKIMLNSVEYTGSGGDSGMELTYNEYLALPEEEKTNGTTYYVKDINGIGEDQFQPIIYSEDEHEIGVWTDGRPIYKKTVVNTLALTSSWQQYIPASDIAVVISAEGIYRRGGEYVSCAFSQYAIGAWILRDGYIQVGINGGENDWEIVALTIRYTKSTDQPGSGQWTPQGVPALHYSTEEQVVGTWIDGSTLYEKTYVTSTISNTTLNIDLGFPIGMGVIVHGYYLLNDSSGSMISANQWFASNNFSWTHIELNTHKLKCTLTGYTGIGYITIRYTKTTS